MLTASLVAVIKASSVLEVAGHGARWPALVLTMRVVCQRHTCQLSIDGAAGKGYLNTNVMYLNDMTL